MRSAGAPSPRSRSLEGFTEDGQPKAIVVHDVTEIVDRRIDRNPLSIGGFVEVGLPDGNRLFEVGYEKATTTCSLILSRTTL